jgi:hypothetical protein
MPCSGNPLAGGSYSFMHAVVVTVWLRVKSPVMALPVCVERTTAPQPSRKAQEVLPPDSRVLSVSVLVWLRL